jgi:cytochrome c oxidase accessory protein FixG
VLLDIPHRRFALFGLAFWAHEAPMLFFVLAGAALTLFGATAVWGRVWCGWACPQTVFVDAVFRRLERWLEGDAFVRRRLDAAPWGAGKLARKAAKWAAFAGVSLLISHSFLAYFVGPEELARMITRPPSQSPGAFAFMTAMFAAVLFDFGWFQEQFCTVVCPYGRFQSVLMDEGSQAVTYDPRRGEPRKGQAAPGQASGDCVNCYRCVQVCPTGIDIRRGLQMECIGCTACIDACDEVMARLKKPPGLIRYTRSRGLSARGAVYGLLLLAVAGAFGLALSRRQTVALDVLRAPEAPYQELEGGRVINHFKLDLANQGFDDLAVSIESPSRIVVSNHAPSLAGGAAERADLFVELPRSGFEGGHARAELVLTARDVHGAVVQTTRREVRLVGPYR